MSNPIRDAYDDYRLRVVPLDAGNYQVIETRRAYFAGAGAVVKLLLASPNLALAPLLARELDALREEVERFRAEVRADRA